MFFNCNESSYKVGCWATVVEALGGMAGALWFFSLVLEEKATHWNVLIWLVSFSLKLHFLLKFRRPFFSPLFLVYYFLLLKEVSSCKICFIPLWKKWVFFFFSSWQNKVLEILGFVMSPNERLVIVTLSTVLHCGVHLSFLEIGFWILMILKFLCK